MPLQWNTECAHTECSYANRLVACDITWYYSKLASSSFQLKSDWLGQSQQRFIELLQVCSFGCRHHTRSHKPLRVWTSAEREPRDCRRRRRGRTWMATGTAMTWSAWSTNCFGLKIKPRSERSVSWAVFRTRKVRWWGCGSESKKVLMIQDVASDSSSIHIIVDMFWQDPDLEGWRVWSWFALPPRQPP